MNVRIHSTAFVSAMIITTFASLLIIILLNQIDQIVHVVLYQFGLQFSYRWVWPYWIYSGIIIGFSWVNIIASIGLVNSFLKARRQSVPLEQRGEVEVDDQQRDLGEFVESSDVSEVQLVEVSSGELAGQTEGLIEVQLRESPLVLQRVEIKKYDVRRPKDVVDSQC